MSCETWAFKATRETTHQHWHYTSSWGLPEGPLSSSSCSLISLRLGLQSDLSQAPAAVWSGVTSSVHMQVWPMDLTPDLSAAHQPLPLRCLLSPSCCPSGTGLCSCARLQTDTMGCSLSSLETKLWWTQSSTKLRNAVPFLPWIAKMWPKKSLSAAFTWMLGACPVLSALTCTLNWMVRFHSTVTFKW